jgi:lipid A disaccharide synthetase
MRMHSHQNFTKSMNQLDILILSNGPGEVATWVRPVVKELRQKLGTDTSQVRISVILSPCPNASGKEADIVNSYPEVDRVQAAKDFFPFLLRGKTRDNWDWRNQGIVIFLGGDQFFPVIIGKRLGYKTIIYAEWDARWHHLIDRFAVMKPETMAKVAPKYKDKFTVVGDLISETATFVQESNITNQTETLIGILPGSKPAKLAQGVPLTLAIAQHIHTHKPEIKFIIPVAPTLNFDTLLSFANPQTNPIANYFGFQGATLIPHLEGYKYPVLQTTTGLIVQLYTPSPAYDILSQTTICLTTVGANTAELGSLAIPMVVLLPTQQLDAMRSWDGILGILANLPGIGTNFAKLINWWFLRRRGLLAWPNIWAQQEIVPELIGKLNPQEVGEQVLDYLNNPEKLEKMRQQLRQTRGETGAAAKLVNIVEELANTQNPPKTNSA